MSGCLIVYLGVSLFATIIGATTNRRDVEIVCRPLGWTFGTALLVFAWGWPVWVLVVLAHRGSK
jgi:hypothetical protein